MANMNSLSLAALEKTSTQFGSIQENVSEQRYSGAKRK